MNQPDQVFMYQPFSTNASSEKPKMEIDPNFNAFAVHADSQHNYSFGKFEFLFVCLFICLFFL